ncbi:MAG: hypothetical protein O7E56_13715 [SAR324 cluster bacterium]|nr:hypothetical protein [SAR324 cluster bacterium]
MSSIAVTEHRPIHPFLWGVFGGALGGLAFLPVMMLLQPTIWAEAVGLVLPALRGTAAEFLGWLIHVSLLALWGGLFAITFRPREPGSILPAALGWGFLLAWFTVMAVTLIHASPLPLLGWVLETLAHAAYGAVLAATLIYVSRPGAAQGA